MIISQNHLDQIKREFSNRPEVIAVYLFGSHARGQAGTLSDIDIGVMIDETKLKQGKTESQYRLDYIDIVMDIFMTDEIDAQIVNNSKPYHFSYNVINERHILHVNNEENRIKKEQEIFSKYQDFYPLKQIYYDFMVQRIKEGTYGTTSI